MRITSWFILCLAVLLNLAVWAWLGRTADGPSWTGGMQGVSYSPSGFWDDPEKGAELSAVEIDEDLRLIDGSFDRVRTYSTAGGLDLVPYIARRHGLDVTLGAWLDGEPARDEPELARLVEAANNNSNVDAVIVGNETLLREDLTVEQLTSYLTRMRLEIRAPVSTAEPWHIWLDHPELAHSVDFLAVHILPYWEGLSVEQALPFLADQWQRLHAAYPDKRIVLTEVGWPSDGVLIGNAVPSPVDQALFLRAFVGFAERNDIDYFLIEAFDQPWKAAAEGTAGGYWGMWDAQRIAKFDWIAPVSNLPNWPVLATLSIALGAVAAFAFLRRARAMRPAGRMAFVLLLQGAAILLVWAFHVAAARYLSSWATAGWVVMGLGLALLLAVLLVEALEWVDVRWAHGLRRLGGPVADNRAPLPRVSVQVAIYNEPPDMVADTLRALSRLDYPDFEVVVLDNNTRDPAVWRPVEAFCADLGPRFRFFHVDHCPGFKAEALNRALAVSDPAAEVIAVIDSDYIVDPNWLRDLVPHFERPEVGLVQAPQDYRDGAETPFKRMCFWEYAGFFRIGMVQRNERNAIIQHGTMTMVRRTALEEAGGWAEWCITEDAELGLRLFELGWQAVYTPRSYGKGVTPDDFAAFKSQRFRWVYGAVQILKRHTRELFVPGGSRLDAGQRYHFLAGWLPWFADGLNVVCTLLALAWTVPVVLFAKVFDFPFITAIALALVLFAFKVAKTVALYRARVGCSFLETLGASLAGLALAYTVAKAIAFGLVTSRQPFLRTPKCENRPALIRALAAVREEAVFLVLLLAAATSVVVVHGDSGLVPMIWAAFLAVQALPFAAAIAVSVVATMPPRRRAVAVGVTMADGVVGT